MTADAARADAGRADAGRAVAAQVDADAPVDADALADVDEPAARPEAPLERRLEAILMVADEPQGAVHLASALAAPVREVRAAIEALRADFDGEGEGPERGFELREVGGGWRFYVRAAYDADVEGFVLTQTPTRLSQAALETLAVIAYKQPITRGAIAAIRAVNVDSVVRTLLGRGLVTEAFTDPETGAIHYETTDLLLQQMGLGSIEELPPISPLLPDSDEDDA